jgi:hypothetical protein
VTAPLDTERVTRAMLAPADTRTRKGVGWSWTPDEDAVLRDRYQGRGGIARCIAATGRTRSAVVRRAGILGLRQSDRWTAAELGVLRREWGDVGERTLRAKLRGRSWTGIAQQARAMGLPSPTQGLVSIKAAAAHIGLHPITLRSILDAAGVQVVRHVRASPRNASNQGRCRWRRVDLERATEAVEAYDRERAASLTLMQAAEHCDVCHDVMHAAMRMLAAMRPIGDRALQGRGMGRWRVSPAEAEAAVALYRDRKVDGRSGRVAMEVSHG